MHVLRVVIGAAVAAGIIVALLLLLRSSDSGPTGPEPAQPVRLRPAPNSSQFPNPDRMPPMDSSVHPEVSELDNLIVGDCLVPRYAPYASVVRITNHSIEVKITDPNEDKHTPSTGYKVYYWGHRLSPKGKLQTHDLVYGKQTFAKDAKHLYSIEGLKSGYSYCADFTALSDCGHGPICSSCFENVIIL